jgi:DNA modification methylase
MIAYLMANSTEPDQIVYDPFLGSGTTLIAAHQLGRVCYGMELSPRYCDVIVKRWESLSGQKAIKH